LNREVNACDTKKTLRNASMIMKGRDFEKTYKHYLLCRVKKKRVAKFVCETRISTEIDDAFSEARNHRKTSKCLATANQASVGKRHHLRIPSLRR